MNAVLKSVGSAPSVDYDVVVVGFGPTGATLARLAARFGLSVLVLEESADVHPLPRAVTFDDECMRIFQSAGIAARVQAISSTVAGLDHVNADGESLLELDVSHIVDDHGFVPGNVMYQPRFDRCLREAAAECDNVDVRLNAHFLSLRQLPDAVSVTFEDTNTGELHTAHTAYLVGADGARSAVRRAIGVELADLGFDQRWLVVDGHLRRALDLPRLAHQYCDPAQPASFIPGVGTHRRWEFMLHPGESDDEALEPENIAHRLRRWLAPEDVEITRSCVYTFHGLLARAFAQGRVFLAGDAAHQMPPFLGQGMCAGLRDAHNLAWKLSWVRKGLASDALLATYHSERAAQVEEIIRMAIRIGRVIQAKHFVCVRDAFFRAARAFPKLKQQFELAKLPPLGAGFASSARDPAASVGAAFPQPLVRDENGRLLRLDEVLGQGFAFLALDRDPTLALGESESADEVRAIQVVPPGSAARPCDARRNARVITDAQGVISDWLGRRAADSVLVRPDRYVFGVYRHVAAGSGVPHANRARADLALALTGGFPRVERAVSLRVGERVP